tara:strand:- start:482 stop:898 length:417 start_codon:yes stop_codon:yes gene_type:complete
MIGSKRGKENGLDVHLLIEPDPFSRPENDDCYTPKQIAAWRDDEWCYVSATVTLSLNGVEIGSAMYSGLEFDTFLNTNDDDEITGTKEIDEDTIWEYVGDELAGEALSNAYEFSDAMQAWRVANPTIQELVQLAKESA